MNVGWTELVLIFLILLLLFGSRLPEVGRSLGKGIKSFKDGLSGIGDESKSEGKPAEKKDAYATGGEADEEKEDEKEKAEEAVPSEGKDRAG